MRSTHHSKIPRASCSRQTCTPAVRSLGCAHPSSCRRGRSHASSSSPLLPRGSRCNRRLVRCPISSPSERSSCRARHLWTRELDRATVWIRKCCRRSRGWLRASRWWRCSTRCRSRMRLLAYPLVRQLPHRLVRRRRRRPNPHVHRQHQVHPQYRSPCWRWAPTYGRASIRRRRVARQPTARAASTLSGCGSKELGVWWLWTIGSLSMRTAERCSRSRATRMSSGRCCSPRRCASSVRRMPPRSRRTRPCSGGSPVGCRSRCPSLRASLRRPPSTRSLRRSRPSASAPWA